MIVMEITFRKKIWMQQERYPKCFQESFEFVWWQEIAQEVLPSAHFCQLLRILYSSNKIQYSNYEIQMHNQAYYKQES